MRSRRNKPIQIIVYDETTLSADMLNAARDAVAFVLNQENGVIKSEKNPIRVKVTIEVKYRT